MEFTIAFQDKGRNAIDFPTQKYQPGAYRIRPDAEGGVEVSGNKNGLLFLAEVLTRCALADLEPGFHVHLPLEGVMSGPDTSGGPELTLYSASTDVQ